ncbi:MAG: right-handed parallel beta-helix repeat-containing protein [Phycisphaeraceae bacterium]
MNRPIWRLLAAMVALTLSLPATARAQQTLPASGDQLTSSWFDSDAQPQLTPGQNRLGSLSWRVGETEEGQAGWLQLAPGDQAATVAENVQQGTGQLHFLHSFHPGPAIEAWREQVIADKYALRKPTEGPAVLVYRLHYPQGEPVDIAVRYREGIAKWDIVGEPPFLTWAVPADRDAEGPMLWHMSVPNPRPDQTIERIEAFVPESDQPLGEAAVVAFRAEPAAQDATLRYVAPDGDDDNPGSFEQPWGTIEAAAERIEPGMTVLVRGGEYPLESTARIDEKGRGNAWMTLAAFPGEVPVIDAFNLEIGNDAIALDHAEYVQLKGLHIHRVRDEGIVLDLSSHVNLFGNTTYKTFRSGIAAWGSAGTKQYCRHVRVLGNTLVQPNTRSMSLTLEGEPIPYRRAPHEGMSMGRVADFELAHNEIYGGDKEGIDSKGPNRRGRIHHNYIHHQPAVGIYLDSWSDTMEDLEVDHNIVHNAYGITLGTEGQSPLENTKVHHNLVYDAHTDGINVWGNASDIQVYNNTAYHNGQRRSRGAGIAIDEDPQRVVVTRNLSIANKGSAIQVSGENTGQRVRLSRNLTVADEDPMIAPEEGDFRLQPDIRQPVGATEIGAPASLNRTDTHIVISHVPQQWLLERAAAEQAAGEPLPKKGKYQPLRIPSAKFNAFISQSIPPGWFIPRYMYQYDGRYIPMELNDFRDVPFFVASPEEGGAGNTVMMLAGFGSETDDTEITGIPVGEKAAALHFLHVYHASPDLFKSEGNPELFKYVVNYQDGSTAEVPVRWKQEIGNWIYDEDQQIIAAENAEVAIKHEDIRFKAGRADITNHLAAYRYRWENPHPDREIESVDMVRAAERKAGSAALMAITAED